MTIPEPNGWRQRWWWIFKVSMGWGVTLDGSICWVSNQRYWRARELLDYKLVQELAQEVLLGGEPLTRVVSAEEIRNRIKFMDPHDFHVYKGGDGMPSHFHTYTCHACDAEFSI